MRVERGGLDRQEPNRLEEREGDICGEKCDDCIRLLSNNVNSLGQVEGSEKEMIFKEFVKDYEIDIAGIQETNICWHLMSHKNRIWDRFRMGKEIF